MSALTPEQVQNLTTLMDERYAREMREIADVAGRLNDARAQELTGDRPADELDRALEETVRAADYAVVRQDIEDVRDIIAARRRLAAGSYGRCIDCGDAIAYERLLAYPTAKRCIACQREHEGDRAIRAGRSVR